MMQQHLSRRVCLAPVRNEAWVINSFLAAAKQWATDVIVADQGSTDGTLQMVTAAPGVDVVTNSSRAYDESHRRRILLDRARSIQGKRLLFGLDADEAISANFSSSAEWQQLDSLPPGTILRFRWVNILPGFEYAWIPPEPTAFGFVDDDSDHAGVRIHSSRIPHPPGAPTFDLQEVVVLHFQYVAWERMLSKHRWYQAWEHSVHKKKGPLQIFREYHHMYGWSENEIQPVRPEWLSGYDAAGIQFRSLQAEPVTWWDQEIVQMLRDKGPAAFRKIAIWNQNWNEVADRLGVPHGDLSDPRSISEKTAHFLLTRTQKDRGTLQARLVERCLRMAGW
jgi:hypothetical protein